MQEIKIRCESCHRDFAPDKFYKTKEGHPMRSCKNCVGAMIDVFNPLTFRKFLEELDVPYIPSEWQKMINKYQYVNDKKTGMQKLNPNLGKAVFGKYIVRFRLPSYSKYTYADTEKFIEQEEQLKKEREEAVEKDMEEIKENIENLNMSEDEARELLSTGTVEEINGTRLSSSDLNKLRIKWGKLFGEIDLIRMETLYQEMHSSFEVNTASTEDYLKKIVRTSIMMDSMMEAGNLEEYTKLSKVYDNLMKSAKFTASQEKEDKYIDSIGEFIYLCEEEGFIPRFDTSEPQDIVDITLRDLSNYTKELVINELNLDSMVDTALQNIDKEEEQEKNGDDGLFDEVVDHKSADEYLEDLMDEVEGV